MTVNTLTGRFSTSAIYSQIRPATWVMEIPLLALFNLVLVGSAFVSFNLPWTPVPITGQTFAIMLVAMSLGRVRAGVVTLAYLIEGALGLPVFAGGAAGPLVLLGPTGGYLFGFLGAANLVGWLADRGWDRDIIKSTLAMTLGHVLVFAAGLAQLALFVPGSLLLAQGFYPFLAGTLVKILLAAGLLPAIWLWQKSLQSRQ